jgi:hypothetical protein
MTGSVACGDADGYGGFHVVLINERIGVIKMVVVPLMSRFCRFRPFEIERQP